jgi:hypothetical protein
VAGVRLTMATAAFNYSQAERTNAILNKHRVRFVFFGKSGAILLGFSDTTQDVDIFPRKERENCKRLIAALSELGFNLKDSQKTEIAKGKDFIQLRDGPFDLDLVFAPDGVESFDDVWRNRVVVEGFPVANIDDIIKSKRAAGRPRDKESLPRLLSFRDWLSENKMHRRRRP